MGKALSTFLPTIPSLLTTLFLFSTTVSSDFYTDINLSYGEQNIKILDNGHLLQLNLDNVSGSGFESKHHYLFGIFHMQIKLVAGNSAGTVTAFYLSSEGSTHDEIDFEFLGNVSGEPYVLHTNVFTQGEGNREQEFYLWFDPRADFHNYSVLWNLKQILFFVDGTPIRVFKNLESSGVPYPKYQPMNLYSSLWNGDEWATRRGLVKIDWSQAPFTASYRNFTTDACIWSAGKTSCSTSGGSPPRRWWNRALDSKGEEKIKRVQREYMIYNYCVDTKKFPMGFPPECYL